MRRPEMDCSRVQRALEEYFEGTLPARRREEVARHLRECAGCAAELGQIEKIAAALAAAPLVEPSAELLGAITTRAGALPAPGARRALVRGWRRVGALAGVLVGALAGVRYGLPLLWPKVVGALAPALAWLGKEGAVALAWLEPKLELARVVLAAGWRIIEALAEAMVAAGPTVGLYVAAELALVLGIVFAVRWGRGRIRARMTTMVV